MVGEATLLKKNRPFSCRNIRNTRQKGDTGEDVAAEYLLSKGYSILTRNYRKSRGEIDCVAKDPDGTLVFVEVKSSRGISCGHPFTWVTKSKQHTLTKIATWYLAENHITHTPCRFDVIAVVDGKVDHLRNAFFAC